MARSLAALVAHLLRERTRDNAYHVHMGAEGRPYVCHDRTCSSPSLSPHDM